MASGYIHITRKDLILDEDNGVVYWKNGGRYLGEIAKAVLNAGEENETVKYYLKSAVTKKAILIDAGVTVGGGDYYFVTDEANFINTRIETADFSSDGGGDGVTVTFLLPESKYYTVRYVEENGDIKLFDVDGDAGTLVPDALPDVTDAAAGDALVLDSDKKPKWAPSASPYYIFFQKKNDDTNYCNISYIDMANWDWTKKPFICALNIQRTGACYFAVSYDLVIDYDTFTAYATFKTASINGVVYTMVINSANNDVSITTT